MKIICRRIPDRRGCDTESTLAHGMDTVAPIGGEHVPHPIVSGTSQSPSPCLVDLGIFGALTPPKIGGTPAKNCA